MSEPLPILTPEMEARVERLLFDWRATGRAPGGAGQDFARMARELGVGIVDMARNRAWVDEKVHEGALFRARHERERADKAERAVAELQGLMGGEGR